MSFAFVRPSKPHILFLPNVFLSDCPTETDFLNEVGTYEFQPTTPIVEEQYDSIPSRYVTYDTWPKSTNLLCWGCGNKCPGMPWPIITGIVKVRVPRTNPLEFDSEYEADTEEKIDVSARCVYGNFCTPWCASRYINQVNDPKIKKWEARKMLADFYAEVTGKKLPDIPEAEDKTIMMQYCGPSGITPQEFRARNEEKEHIFKRHAS